MKKVLKFEKCPECDRDKPVDLNCICEIAADLPEEMDPDELIYLPQYSEDMTAAIQMVFRTLGDFGLLTESEAQLWLDEARMYTLLPRDDNRNDLQGCFLLKMPQKYRAH